MPIARALPFAFSVTALLVATSMTARAQSRGEPPRPPREAVEACSGKGAGAACSFTVDGQALEGTCFTPDADRPLACRPSGAPPLRE